MKQNSAAKISPGFNTGNQSSDNYCTVSMSIMEIYSPTQFLGCQCIPLFANPTTILSIGVVVRHDVADVGAFTMRFGQMTGLDRMASFGLGIEIALHIFAGRTPA
jgi:hypothetical protein